MIKVITYGTYDVLHRGHVRLLERAKSLGDYLIVGVTSDDYDRSRGKINNRNSLFERIAAVKALGIADQILVEEYDGQKIDDIRRLQVDIFTVGSDWKGEFDYLNEFCKVIYLQRTEGISSTEVRSDSGHLSIGICGYTGFIEKFINETKYVNGMQVIGIYCKSNSLDLPLKDTRLSSFQDYQSLLANVDAVYVVSEPDRHYDDVKEALLSGKHVLCESPIATSKNKCCELFDLARRNKLILMDGIKTAYSTAYERLVLMAKGGKIGDVVSVDAVCTSLWNFNNISEHLRSHNCISYWNSVCDWAPSALLPIFQIFGVNFKKKVIYSKFYDKSNFDIFTKIDFVFNQGVGSIKVAKGAKSEGSLVITGTKGYIYVPSPWWKTDYFEIRYEDFRDNKRFFYQLDGEGIRYELVAFSKAIESGKNTSYVYESISEAICLIIQDYNSKTDLIEFFLV